MSFQEYFKFLNLSATDQNSNEGFLRNNFLKFSSVFSDDVIS